MPARCEGIRGPLGVRFEVLTGHVTGALGRRNRLGTVDAFRQLVTEKLLCYLHNTCDNGNHQALPRLLAPIVEVQSGLTPRVWIINGTLKHCTLKCGGP